MKFPNLSELKAYRLFTPALYLLPLLILRLGTAPAVAATEQWLGVPGTSATTNWTDPANWTSAQQTYYNQVQFAGTGTSANTSFSVNNVLDGTTGVSQMPIWELDYVPTNGNYTTLIDPGITMTLAAGWGSMYVGADALNNSSPAPANAVETITIEGSGATFSMTGGLYLGQGSTTPGDTHNVTLDFSGLDNFVDNSSHEIYVASGGTQRANGTLYLAKTNQINLANAFQISNQNASNSLTCAVYLGLVNTVTLGTGNLIVGGTGTTAAGAWMKFNPAFIGGGNPVPTAYFNGSGTSGRIANFWIGNENGGANVAGYGLCDFTGGNVTMFVDSMQLGQSGTSSATGTLTFDNGVVNANNVIAGDQEVTSGGAGVGVINLNTNTTTGTSATLQVNSTLTLAAGTGTMTSGTAGTIDVNGGTLAAGSIVNGGGVGTINLTGGTLTLGGTAGTASAPVSNLAVTNSIFNLAVISGTNSIVAGNLQTGGSGNLINIASAPPFASYPVQIALVKYAGSISGAGYNFTLGTLPPLYAGHLVNNTMNGSVDLVLTSGSENLTWTGAVNGNWDTTTANWLAGAATAYANGQFVQFLDGAHTGIVNLTTTLSPATLVVSNAALNYAFDGSGLLSGSTGLTKSGSGTLIVDNSGINNFSGGVAISNGTVQVGNNDTAGNLPAGAIVNNGNLVFARSDSVTFGNTISGAGNVWQAGAGGTLALTGANTFSGNVVVTNNSTLQNGSGAALGSGSGSVVIANGSTFDADGNASPKSIVAAGAGVGGNGAITDTGGAVYGLVNNIILTGDTTFGYPNRWDLHNALSTGGNAYNLTLNASTYFEWDNVAVDAALGNINLLSGSWGIVGSTTFGNPSSTLTLAPGATLVFYGSPFSVVNKQVDFQNGATIQNAGGNNIMTGGMTLEAGYSSFSINSGTTLTLSNVLTGSGLLYLNSGTGELVLGGNSPSFTGGIGLYNGEAAVNGLIGSGVTSIAGTIVAGGGTVQGLADVSGELAPGDVGVVGTFHAQGGLTLEGGATVLSDLDSTTGGNNDLIQVTGDLTVNGNTITINPINGALANGTYTLATYTGNLNGSFGSVSTVAPSSYNFVLNNVTTTTPKQIQLVVTTTVPPSAQVWNNASGNGQWDVQSSANWSNATTHVSADQFQVLDSVLFNDSITNSVTPATIITIPSGQLVVPSAITNNSTVNYTIGGAGEIGGAASLVKLGSGTLTMQAASDLTGTVTIGGGTLQMDEPLYGATTTLGATNGGPIYVTNGATLVVNSSSYYGIGTRRLVISGAGAGGNGALIGNGTIYNGSVPNGGLFRSLTLAGNATIGSTNGRTDLGNASGGLATVISTGGSNYNLTVLQQGYSEWHEVTIDTNLGNIDYVLNSPTTWAVLGLGASLGNPTNTLTLHPGVSMNIGHDSVNNADSGYAKNVHVLTNASFTFQPSGGNGDYHLGTSLQLDAGASWNFYSGNGGTNTGTTIGGTVTFNGVTHLQIGDSAITLTNVISGPGGFVWDNYNNQLVFSAVNTYSGPTAIGSGRNLVLTGNGSISDSSLIFLGGNNPANNSLDVSGRSDQTLTLASGQTLAGIGGVNGKLVVSPGAVLSPAGTNTLLGITSGANSTGTISVSNNVTLSGTTVIKLNGSGVNDTVQSSAGITYGGTLNLVNISGAPLAAGNSFQIFSAKTYAGSFTGINPATPGAGLAWDTSQLNIGFLNVAVVAGAGPVIAGVAISNGNLVFNGTGGPANGTYYVLVTTNLAPANWVPVETNMFDVSGNFHATNAITAGVSHEFYRIEQP